MKTKTKTKPRTLPPELREQLSAAGRKGFQKRIERARLAAKEKEQAK